MVPNYKDGEGVVGQGWDGAEAESVPDTKTQSQNQ